MAMDDGWYLGGKCSFRPPPFSFLAWLRLGTLLTAIESMRGNEFVAFTSVKLAQPPLLVSHRTNIRRTTYPASY
eukprot:scaffold1065_cov114-Skeletonema_dohrnii-CCMP3373.AAC.4